MCASANPSYGGMSAIESRAAQRGIRPALDRARRAHGGWAFSDFMREVVWGRWVITHAYDQPRDRVLIARRATAEETRAHALSKRERQVVAFTVRGTSYKVAAYELGVSEPTVAAHLRSALRKLCVGNRSELIRALPLEALGVRGSASDAGVSEPQRGRVALFEPLQSKGRPGEIAVARIPHARIHHADVLTPAEREIASRLARGASYESIARFRSTSRNTVKNQVRAIFEKTGARSRFELICLSCRAPEAS